MNDKEKMEKAIFKFLSEKLLAKRLSAICKLRSQSFSIEKTSLRYEQLYKPLIKAELNKYE